MMGKKLGSRILILVFTLLIFSAFCGADIRAYGDPTGGGKNGMVVFSGTEDTTAAAGASFDLLNGVSASKDGADLTVRVTDVTASGDDSFVFTDGSTSLDPVKKNAVYTVTYKAYAKDDASFTTPLGTAKRTVTGSRYENTYDYVWQDGSVKTEISDDKRELSITPTHVRDDTDGFYTASLSTRLSFSTGGDRTYAPYSIEFRIPYRLFKDRDGNYLDKMRTALPAYPGTDSQGSFNYEIDEENNEIIIRNFEEISQALFLSTTFTWQFSPLEVKDGYTNNAIQAKYKATYTDSQGQEHTEESHSVPITVTNHSTAKINAAEKSFNKGFEKWQNEWGTKPDDADDYFYVRWKVYWSVEGVQPFIAYLDEQAGTDVVGWYEPKYDSVLYSGASSGGSSELVGPSSVFHPYTEGTRIATYWSNNPVTNDPPINGYSTYGYSTGGGAYIVCRYKRADYQEKPATIRNHVDVNLEGIDGAKDTKAVEAAHEYEGFEYLYPGDYFYLNKNNQGGASCFSYRDLLNGRPVKMRPGSGFQLESLVRGWDFTKSGDTYGEKPYTVLTTDDYVMLRGEELDPEDYEFTTVILYKNKDLIMNDDNSLSEDTDPDQEPCIVYIKTRNNPEWTQYDSIGYAEFQKNNGWPVTVKFPEGTYAFRVGHTTKSYQTEIKMSGIGIQFNPTDHVKKIVKNAIDDKLDAVPVRNVGTMAVRYSDGHYHDFATSDSTLPNTSDANKDKIFARDRQEYGGALAKHDESSGKIMDYPFNAGAYKSSHGHTTDKANGREIIHYVLSIHNSLTLNKDSYTTDTVSELDPQINNYQNGTFYDLLPLGAYVNTSEVKVATYYNSQKPEATEYVSPEEYTVTTEPNWHGTGRTMLKIRVNLKEKNLRLVNPYSEYYYWSILDVIYDLYYPWESIEDYGKTVYNDFLYVSDSDTELRPRTEQNTYYPSSEPINGKYADVDGDGQHDQRKRYLQSPMDDITLPAETMSQAGYYKEVRSEDSSGDFDTEATAVAGGMYDYRLRFVTRADGKTSDVIIYDVLEEAYGENPHWKGTFESIDTAQPVSKGIDPVVYYSTVSGLDPKENASQADLSNAAVWSTEMPADKSKITAVAVDLRKKTDGSEYIFDPLKSAVVTIRMKAPADARPYRDPVIYAYNDAQVQQKFQASASSAPLDAVIEKSSFTKVSLDYPVDIHKTSDPKTGTQENPAEVKTDAPLTYTVSVSNKNTQEAINKVEVTDPIPKGLEIDKANIRYYLGSMSADSAVKVSDSDWVHVTQNGQKLVFMLDTMKAGETVHLVIPTTVRSEERYDNTATITGIDGEKYDIDSETTHHRRIPKPATLIISKKIAGKQSQDRDRSKLFAFSIQFTKPDGTKDSGKYDCTVTDTKTGSKVWSGRITSSSGSSYVSIKHNQTLTVTGIPSDYSYQVWEWHDSGWTPYAGDKQTNVASGTFTEGAVVTLDYTNYRQSKVKFRKVDENNIALSGAILGVVKGTDPNPSDEDAWVGKKWMTGPRSWTMTLGEGVYTLVEVTAPSGYEKADPITFKLDRDGNLYILQEDGTWAKQGSEMITMQDQCTPEEVTLKAHKTLDGKTPEGSDFTFVLKDDAGKTLETVRNNGGEISFAPLKLTRTGTYRFTVVEQKGKDDGIIYDASKYTATVKADLKARTVEVEWAKDGKPYDGDPVFANKTAPPEPPKNPEPEKPEHPKGVKTGDDGNPALWIVLMLTAAGLAFTAAKKRNEDR